ncbi:MAG: NAD(P)H-hydrate epimerase [Novosphingobium sp.]
MPRHADQILTAAQMRTAEEALIAGGSSIDELMQRAGRGAAEWVWRIAAGRAVTVLCGPGNNGGDGWVIAEVLRERGGEVCVIAAAEPATAAARTARALYRGAVSTEPVRGEVLVDCLFGSGLARPLSEAHLGLLQRLAVSHHLTVAVDLPSGIDADTGAPLNPLLPDCDVTLALGAWKRAHWAMPAMATMGVRCLVEIGIERVVGAAELLGRPHLFAPAVDAHKYTRGFVGVVGGAMPGAGVLAAQAAMRGGAGYVKLFADHPGPCDLPDLVVESETVSDLVADPRLNALVIGPGLGRDGLAREKLEQVLRRELPTVVDGDALTLLAPAMLSGRREALVLTPHAGELEQLYAACEIEAGDRIGRLLALAHDTRSVVIAKGPDTLIAASDGALTFAASSSAPSWLSVAGSGDVLAGLVASRIAAGRTLYAAAREAVWLHSRAGQLAGPACLPGDIVCAAPQAFAECL